MAREALAKWANPGKPFSIFVQFGPKSYQASTEVGK